MSFYMTLPSDSSKNQSPQNRIGNCTTASTRDISLESSYEVGLSEILLPSPKSAVKKMQYLSYVDLNKPDKGRRFIGFAPECFLTFTRFQRSARKREYSQFSDIEYSMDDYDLVGIPMREERTKEKLPFSFALRERGVILSVSRNCELHFSSAFHMARLFGFINNQAYIAGADKSETFTGAIDYIGANNMDLLYLYCDIVEYSIVGDTLAPCLRTIPLTSRDSQTLDRTIVERFENPHYVPVSSSRFSEVSIEIANELGDEIQFGQGLTLIKLHFRPKKR